MRFKPGEESEDLREMGGPIGLQNRLLEDGHNITPNDLANPRIQNLLAKLIRERDEAIHKVDTAIGDVVHYQWQAATDALTELQNRRAFDKAFATAQGVKAEDPRQIITLVFFDVNEFKKVNTEHSQTGGDTGLKSIAYILDQTPTKSNGETPKQRIRNLSVASVLELLSRRATEKKSVYRLGGDEFVAILYDTDKKGAEVYIQHIMDKVLRSRCEYNGKRIPLSITGGCHELQPGESLDDVQASASKDAKEKKAASYKHAKEYYAKEAEGLTNGKEHANGLVHPEVISVTAPSTGIIQTR